MNIIPLVKIPFCLQEMDNLKHKLESTSQELLEKERAWLKEKEDLLLQKDLERRRDLDKLQDQSEMEYKQFIEEHKDTLDKALKAAREQHNKDKVCNDGFSLSLYTAESYISVNMRFHVVVFAVQLIFLWSVKQEWI